MTDSPDKPRCDREDLHSLLAAYEFGALPVVERRAFERHALECDACFEELERGAAVVEVLRAQSDRFRRGLASAPSIPGVHARRRPLRRSIPSPRVLAPALAVLVAGLAITTWMMRGSNPARLATFPRDPMRSSAMRGPVAPAAVRELMEAGAAYFDLGRYEESARRFRAALQREPGHVEAAYALGLSLALAGDVSGAIPPLEQAARLAPPELRDRARWVLANARLKSGDVAGARRELEALASAPGEYASRARELEARLAR